jgi:hypothetical protein
MTCTTPPPFEKCALILVLTIYCFRRKPSSSSSSHLHHRITIAVRSIMPPSAPSQSSPLSASMLDDSNKAPMADGFGTAPAPASGPPLSSSSLYHQDPSYASNSMWTNNGLMGSSSPAMNSYPGLMYGSGGMNTPFLSPMMPLTTISTGPFSNITNYLLGLQNVILSIGQVVQIISFNTNSLQQLCESVLAMFEHAVRTWHEQLPAATTDAREASEPQQQQRRIRALRYAAAVAFTYLGYTIVRAIRNRYRHRRNHSTRQLEYAPPIAYPPPLQYPPPTVPMSPYYNTPYPQSGMPPYHHPNYPYSGGPSW